MEATSHRIRSTTLLPFVVLILLTSACESQGSTEPGVFFDFNCSIPAQQLFDGNVGIDGIPALTNPRFVQAWDTGIAYLGQTDRVIGVVVGGQPYAIPHNILWWHEIVNLIAPGGERIAVSYCPLTGSSMAFDIGGLGEGTLRVSGLLFETNLVMYDTNSQRSLWPQMLAGARCGVADGTALPMVAAWDMTWAGWQALYPETLVVHGETGSPRDYTVYPYGNYEAKDNSALLFPISRPIDQRRPPKERILGIRSASGSGGVAFPFGELAASGATAAVPYSLDGRDMVILWESSSQGGMAFSPELNGTRLTFVAKDGRIRDEETGSRWKVSGEAIDGPMLGERLTPIADAYVAFWFAWAVFHPQTEIWTHTGGT